MIADKSGREPMPESGDPKPENSKNCAKDVKNKKLFGFTKEFFL